ncbi:MAG: ribulose-phosphate 3-epimerase [Candidatus Neomarinimicrobiota bacterium]
MTRIISPSLLSADFTRLEEQIKIVESAGAVRLHMDVMDGHFVPNITFGPLIVEAINRLAAIPLDVHLMIENPDRYLEQFAAAGAQALIVHLEASRDLARDLTAIRKLGVIPGVAINPDTPFDSVAPYIDQFEYLLIMSVFPGSSGQEFIESTLDTMRTAVAAREGRSFLVAVDGGVNLDTIERVRDTGIDIAVVGSGLYKAPDIADRFKELSR